MDDQNALKMESPTISTSEATSDNDTVNSVKLPPNNKSNRYYYRNRELILEKRILKKLEDPEYKVKYEEKQKKKAEKELLRAQKEEKRKIMAEMVSKKL